MRRKKRRPHAFQQRTNDLVRSRPANRPDVAVEHAHWRSDADTSGEIVRQAWIYNGGPYDSGVVTQVVARIADANPCNALSIAFVLGAGLFAGCMVGPNYKRPNVAVQSRWEHPGSTQPSIVDDASPPLAWWATLNNPTLSSLVQRASRGNLSVSIAKSRIHEARAERSIAAGGLLPSVGASGNYTFNRAGGPLFCIGSA